MARPWTAGALVGAALRDDDCLVAGLGAAVTIGSVLDRGARRCLAGHTAPVTCVACVGDVVASGQAAAVGDASRAAPVMVWNAPPGAADGAVPLLTARHTLHGLHGGVSTVAVTGDGCFVAAASTAGEVGVWDCRSGEVVLLKARPAAAVASGEAAAGGSRCVLWLPPHKTAAPRAHPSYTLIAPTAERVAAITLRWDHALMRFVTTEATAALPPSGFARRYTCGAVDAGAPTEGAGGTTRVVLGTAAGELVTFAVPDSGGAPVFKGAVSVAKHGVTSLVLARAADAPPDVRAAASAGAPRPAAPVVGAVPGMAADKSARIVAGGGVATFTTPHRPMSSAGGATARPTAGEPAMAYVGSGDGRIVAYRGLDTDWTPVAEGAVPAAEPRQPIVSLAMPPSRLWLVATTGSGALWRVGFTCDLGLGPPAPSPRLAISAPAAPSAFTSVLLEQAPAAAVVALAAVQGGGALVTATADGCVQLWEADTGLMVATARCPGPAVPSALWAAPCLACDVAPGSAAGGGGAVAGMPRTSFGTALAAAAAVPPPASSGSASSVGWVTVYVGDAAARTAVAVDGGGGLRALNLSLTGGDSGPVVWSARAHAGAVTALAGSHDVVVSGGADGVTTLWSRSTRAQLASWKSHGCPVASVVVHSGDAEGAAAWRWTAATGVDGLVQVFSAAPGRSPAACCDLGRRGAAAGVLSSWAMGGEAVRVALAGGRVVDVPVAGGAVAAREVVSALPGGRRWLAAGAADTGSHFAALALRPVARGAEGDRDGDAGGGVVLHVYGTPARVSPAAADAPEAWRAISHAPSTAQCVWVGSRSAAGGWWVAAVHDGPSLDAGASVLAAVPA